MCCRFLPIANVSRIMKASVPKSGKIAKDAKECVQECVSEFISFITSEASEKCALEKRKTINGEDLIFAMQTLGFDSYVEPLRVYLQKYREVSVRNYGFQIFQCQLFEPVVFLLLAKSFQKTTCASFLLGYIYTLDKSESINIWRKFCVLKTYVLLICFKFNYTLFPE